MHSGRSLVKRIRQQFKSSSRRCFWENNATYGNADSATRDDYKNPGYFALNATDIMIWHVPNNTAITSIDSEAFFKFHTSTGFLSLYGGNLASLYHFPMRSGQYSKEVDNGPAIPIIWGVGSNDTMMNLLGRKTKQGVEPAYVQFRAINYEKNAFALCPGVKIKPNFGNVEHVCIGSTSNNIGAEARYCGDFAAMDYPEKWGSDQKLINAVAMIFYK